MKIKYLFIILTSLSLFASSPSVMAQNKDSLGAEQCHNLLTTYIKAWRDPSVDHTSLKAIGEYLEEANEITDNEVTKFSRASEIVPLFNSGMVHKAIARELKARGHKNFKKTKEALTAFRFIKNSDEQVGFVDAVVNRLRYTVDTRVSLSDQNEMKRIRKAAKKNNMSFEQYLEFADTWDKHRKSNFIVIKLAILQQLLTHDESFAKNVSSYSTLYRRALSFFESEPKIIEAPQASSVEFLDLALDVKTAFSSDKLDDFLREAPLTVGEDFIEGNFDRFSTGQLNKIIEGGNFKNFNEDTTNLLTQRWNHLKEIRAPYLELKDKEKKILRSLSDEEAQLTTLKEESAIRQPLSEKDMIVVMKMLDKMDKYSYDTETNSALETFLNQYTGRFNGPQFRKVAIRIAEAAHRYRMHNTTTQCYDILQKAALNVYLSSDDVFQIKTEIQKEIDRYNDVSESNRANAILTRPWGKTQSYLNPQERAEKIKNLDSVIADLQTQKSKVQTDISDYLEKLKRNEAGT